MKKTIIFATLILGMSAMAMAQSCGGGYGYSSSTNYYDHYNDSFQRLGIIESKWRGRVQSEVVIDARIVERNRKRIIVEYVLANGDILEVQGTAGRPEHVGGQGGGHNYGAPYTSGVNNSNNYYYSASQQHRVNEFTLHCATLNGFPLDVKCGTLKLRRGYGYGVNTILNLEIGHRDFFRGNVKIF